MDRAAFIYFFFFFFNDTATTEIYTLSLHDALPISSSRQTSRTPAERSAATATDRASLGSFLLMFPAASSRTRAASLGGTSSTRSPAASSCWASRWPTPPAPPAAQVRCGQACAHPSSRSAWAVQARTCSWPSGTSAGSMATAVCEALCGSIPIITTTMGTPSSLSLTWDNDRGGHAQFQVSRLALAHLL